MQLKPYSRQVFYYETDQMGIVHHSNYIRWLEEARIDFMAQMGLSYAAMEEMGILIPVLGVSVTYKVPFRYGESMYIYVKPYEYNGIKLKLEYELRNAENGQICSLGKSEHCFCTKDMKPMSLKKSYPELSAKFEAMIPEKA